MEDKVVTEKEVSMYSPTKNSRYISKVFFFFFSFSVISVLHRLVNFS
jgi:hypothetical protein